MIARYDIHKVVLVSGMILTGLKPFNALPQSLNASYHMLSHDISIETARPSLNGIKN